jgi:uncharacterized protein YdhG (YjbR/CyaY superfamily)
MEKYESVDAYINAQPAFVLPYLQQIRALIRKAAPMAEEYIGYGMPAYKLHDPLVYFAACKTHIGFYPTPSAIIHFEKQLVGYNYSKGAVQFKLHERLPATLITRMVKFKVAENTLKAAKARKKI